MKWAAGLAALAGLWLTVVAVWVWIGPPQDAGGRADAAIVLGAAVDGDVPSPVFAARIDHAIDLYREGRVSRLIFTGARSYEDTASEAAAARSRALAADIPADAIAVEERSHTTRQNLIEARALLNAEDRRVLIVSDPLHLRRAVMMAHDLGIDVVASATPYSRYRSWRTRLPFLAREVYFLHHYWLFEQ
ncbi:YdcF family protein [Erythrobacter sp.]|jgi:uncharacterized SAM-binding protein YcdF (DUF218 family)|uniref:YdcF family protein n=1 Tax=Erythrobacter sp. TaxID=1042 RepID=UPI002E9E744A|nr:YdcF family protein [Erythrobacter sp.]